MSAIELNAFAEDLVVCEAVHKKTASGKASTSVRLSYGPARRAISLVTPPCVVDWPMLHGDGDYGSKFGPDQLDKVDVTDQGHPHEDREAMARSFAVVRAIDEKLVAFVHANQRELLCTRDLSEDGIRAKRNAAAKDKFDSQDVLQFTKQTLSFRKLDWKGRDVELRIVDAARKPYTEPILQGDICIVAAGIEYVYFIPQQGFGVKWGLPELMRLAPGTGGGASSDYSAAQPIQDSHISRVGNGLHAWLLRRCSSSPQLRPGP
jgi:hypothetical protein